MNTNEEIDEIILGIDLGTSNSAACFFDGEQFMMVPSAEGTNPQGKSFPSYVAFTEEGEELIGEVAKRLAVNNPEGTISSVKRFMGKNKKYTIHGKEYTPEVISAMILKKIKIDSEEYFGEEINKAVITVPANFDNNQRTATKDAAEMAGLEVVTLMNEPTAASLAYGFDKSPEDELTVLVFDIGGGTLDVTIMEIRKNHFSVLSTEGNNNLGGNDMDKLLAKYLANEIEKEHGIDIYGDDKGYGNEEKLKNIQAKLINVAENAKIELSEKQETHIEMNYIPIDDENNYINFETNLTREKLESEVEPLVNKCGETIEKAIKNAFLDLEDIDKVILVGGPTKMPIVKRYVEDYLGKKSESEINPMQCVAQGASLLADIKETNKGGISVVNDITPHSLGTVSNYVDTVIMIEKGSPLPYSHTQTFKTVSDYQTEVTIEIVEGEDEKAKNNVFLGSFDLEIPPAKKGKEIIEVTFYKDESNLLTVTAKNQNTGKTESISIDYDSRMSAYEKHIKQQELQEMGKRYKESI